MPPQRPPQPSPQLPILQNYLTSLTYDSATDQVSWKFQSFTLFQTMKSQYVFFFNQWKESKPVKIEWNECRRSKIPAFMLTSLLDYSANIWHGPGFKNIVFLSYFFCMSYYLVVHMCSVRSLKLWLRNV